MSKAISKAIGIVVTVICVIGSITTIFAQDGNGISNPDSYGSDTSNWCDGGGVWGPELCNSGQLAPPEWMYQAGWYWQRVIEGDISVAQVPEPYRGNTNLSSSDNGDGTVTITVQTPTGPRTITIVLLGASGTNRHPNAPATADHELNQDNFDAPSEGAGLGINADDNLVIYGNSANNSITGGDGDDTIHGGDEFAANTGARIGDTINGGPGNDTLNGGNESTSGFNVQAGDTINGGPGDDVINGGDETCNGAFCDALGGGRVMSQGDTIDGGPGNDVINGGDETCNAHRVLGCGGNDLGDTITGGDGDDIINGGNETCSGGRCGTRGGTTGDNIDGEDGNDTVDGGTETSSTGNGAGDTCASANNETESNCP